MHKHTEAKQSTKHFEMLTKMFKQATLGQMPTLMAEWYVIYNKE